MLVNRRCDAHFILSLIPKFIYTYQIYRCIAYDFKRDWKTEISSSDLLLNL